MMNTYLKMLCEVQKELEGEFTYEIQVLKLL